MAKDDVADRVRSLVDGLPRSDRLVVLLYFADGLSAAEIAEVLELPLQKVASLIETFRARAVSRMVRRRAA